MFSRLVALILFSFASAQSACDHQICADPSLKCLTGFYPGLDCTCSICPESRTESNKWKLQCFISKGLCLTSDPQPLMCSDLLCPLVLTCAKGKYPDSACICADCPSDSTLAENKRLLDCIQQRALCVAPKSDKTTTSAINVTTAYLSNSNRTTDLSMSFNAGQKVAVGCSAAALLLASCGLIFWCKRKKCTQRQRPKSKNDGASRCHICKKPVEQLRYLSDFELCKCPKQNTVVMEERAPEVEQAAENDALLQLQSADVPKLTEARTQEESV